MLNKQMLPPRLLHPKRLVGLTLFAEVRTVKLQSGGRNRARKRRVVVTDKLYICEERPPFTFTSTFISGPEAVEQLKQDGSKIRPATDEETRNYWKSRLAGEFNDAAVALKRLRDSLEAAGYVYS
jgi:hypothetical protein